jgi:hypothetical protein
MVHTGAPPTCEGAVPGVGDGLCWADRGCCRLLLLLLLLLGRAAAAAAACGRGGRVCELARPAAPGGGGGGGVRGAGGGGREVVGCSGSLSAAGFYGLCYPPLGACGGQAKLARLRLEPVLQVGGGRAGRRLSWATWQSPAAAGGCKQGAPTLRLRSSAARVREMGSSDATSTSSLLLNLAQPWPCETSACPQVEIYMQRRAGRSPHGRASSRTLAGTRVRCGGSASAAPLEDLSCSILLCGPRGGPDLVHDGSTARGCVAAR